MLSPDQIPDEVAFALLDLYTLWHGNTDQARSAIAAALNAWPGLSHVYRDWDNTPLVCLPLPTEKQNG